MQAFHISNRKFLISVLAILILAWSLRVYDLDGYSLWIDEGMEYWVATSSIHDLPQNVREGIQDPPLYSLILHLWMKTGQQEFFLRFLSVIFSFLGVIGVMLLGYRLSGPTTALNAGIIMAVLPSQIRYAQEVGQYALMICLLTWSLISLQAVLKNSVWPKCLTWTILAILTTYSYYGAVFSLLIPFSIMMLRNLLDRDKENLKKGLCSLMLYGWGIIPLLIDFLPFQLHRGPTTKAFQFTPPHSLLTELHTLLTSTQHLIAFQFTVWPCAKTPSLIIDGLLVIIVMLISFAIRSRNTSYFTLWLLLTWVVHYFINLLHLYPYGHRHSLILAPLLIPVIAQGLSLIQMPKWRYSLLAYILITCVFSLPNRTLRTYMHPNLECAVVEDLRDVTKCWMENHEETDVTYVYYGASPSFRYYLRLFGQDATSPPPTWYVSCLEEEPHDYCHSHNVYYGKWIRHLDPTQKIASIQSTLPLKTHRFWIVFSHIHPGEDVIILKGLSEDYQIVSLCQGENAAAYLLNANPLSSVSQP